MRGLRGTAGRRATRGSALLTVTVLLAVALVLLAAFLQMVGASHSAQVQQRDDLQALYTAEAGLGEAYLALEQELDPAARTAAASLGSEADPREFGHLSYWVEAEDLGARVYALRGSALDRLARERIELVVREIPDGFFRYAVFGYEGVTFRTSAFVDSYDSSIGVYADQYDSSAKHAGEMGNVGSNEDIELYTNTEIYGNASPGPPDHQVLPLGPNTFVSGTTQPADELVPFPPIAVPSIPTSGVANVKNTTLVLGPGEVHYSSIQVSSGGTVEVRGPATLVVDNLLLNANTTLRLGTTGGPIEIYGTGNFVLQANSHLVTNTTRPHDVGIYISSNNVDGRPSSNVTLNANSEYMGLIYAPSSKITIQTMFQVYGSVMAREVELGSNSAVHYDVSLLFDDDNGAPVFEQVSWRPIALQ